MRRPHRVAPAPRFPWTPVEPPQDFLQGDHPDLPTLPPEHTIMPAWCLQDAHRHWRCELERVYGPNGALQPELTFWLASPVLTEGAGQDARNWWLSFAAARRQSEHLDFDHFTSPAWMRSRLRAA